MKNICVVILTYNEEVHIERAIQSVALFAKQIIVVDSYSADNTVGLARRAGVTVLQNPFINQAKQFQWALDNAAITADWIMRLDADEIVEPDLANEIYEKIGALEADVVAVNLKRKHIFLDRWIRHGGRYPLVLTRIWRKGQGRIEDRWMDEHIIVWGGRTVLFDNPFSDHNLNDLTFFTDKHNKYANREAIDVLNKRYNLFAGDVALTKDGSSLQASVKRFIKEKIYNHIPFPISSLGYFLYRYFIQLGFLDGIEGLCYHFLQGLWYRFLVGAKVLEFDRAIRGLPTRESKLDKLREMTGLKL